MPAKPRGALIVIEGLDRAGKSTQCEKLFKYFEQQGRPVKRMRFPGPQYPLFVLVREDEALMKQVDRSTPIGKSIDSYLKGETHQEDHVIHLLFSANRWEAAAKITEDIAKGITIIIDRYYYSGMIYSAAKNNANLSLGWAMQPDMGLPKPDLAICFVVSIEAAAARGGFGHERYEVSDMQKRVRFLFGELLRAPDYPEFIGIDAEGPVEKVYAKMLELVNQALAITDLDKPLKTFQADLDLDALREKGIVVVQG
ncbi:MAG: hypothetical protein Q9202_002966 [Teloschistes flavicans]